MTAHLVGLVGRARAGKDTVAAILNEQSGAERVAFADPLRRFCAEVFDFNQEQVAGQLKETPDPRYTRADGQPLTPRHAMQTLGTEWGRACCSDVWVRLGLRTAAEILSRGWPAVIADVRFANEAQAVRDAGGVIWRVVRPGHASIAATHVSEVEQDSIIADETITNDGTLDELKTRVWILTMPWDVDPLEGPVPGPERRDPR